MKRKATLLFLLLLALTSCSHTSPPLPPDSSVTDSAPSSAAVPSLPESVGAASPSVPEETAQFTPAPDPSVQYPAVLTPSLTNRIDHAVYSEGIFLIYNGTKYGFMRENGQEITPYEYDFANPFSQGLACVSKDGKYGFIDSNGRTALPFLYDKAGSFSEGLAYFETDGRYGFIDQEGKEQFLLDCDSVSSFKEGMAYFSIDGKYGYIGKTGAQAIPPIFDDASYFYNGIAVIRKGPGFGLINIHGQEVISPQYDKIEISGQYILVQSDGKYGCFNQKGKPVAPVRYDSITINPDSSTLLLFDGEHYGLADENGILLSDPIYDSVTAVHEKQLLITTLDGQSGIIGYDGSQKVSAIYDSIAYVNPDSNDMITVLRGDKYGFLDSSDFSQSVPMIYDDVSSVQNNRAAVALNGKYGIIDIKGNLILPMEYRSIYLNADGTMVVCKENSTRFQLLNSEGTLLNEASYDFISAYGQGFKVTLDNKFGYLDQTGKEVIPPIFSYNLYYVYNTSDCIVSCRFASDYQDCLIMTDKPQDIDLSAILLDNEITPRQALFHQFSKHAFADQFDYDYYPGSFRFTFRLYDLAQEGNPILYCYAAPCVQHNFPLSHSGFYAVQNNELIELVTGYECGGSLRGDFVRLWYDREEKSVKIGTTGFFGGFAGHSRVDKIYNYKDGTANRVFSFSFVSQIISNYEDRELKEHAELFYDDNGNPYTNDTISEADYVTEYSVNEQQTTILQYQQCFDRFLGL